MTEEMIESLLQIFPKLPSWRDLVISTPSSQYQFKFRLMITTKWRTSPSPAYEKYRDSFWNFVRTPSTIKCVFTSSGWRFGMWRHISSAPGLLNLGWDSWTLLEQNITLLGRTDCNMVEHPSISQSWGLLGRLMIVLLQRTSSEQPIIHNGLDPNLSCGNSFSHKFHIWIRFQICPLGNWRTMNKTSSSEDKYLKCWIALKEMGYLKYTGMNFRKSTGHI